MNHTISFRRPELRHVLSTMSVPPDCDVAAHIHRLEDLGYKIVEVSPPLEPGGPTQSPQKPELSAIREGSRQEHRSIDANAGHAAR